MFNFTIKEILDATKGALVSGDVNQEIFGISTDTRSIREGELFLALKGKTFDGHGFVEEAVNKGACGAILSSNPKSQIPNPKQIPNSPEHGIPFYRDKFQIKDTFILIQVEDTLKAYSDIAHYYRMKFNIPFIGITGSSGKTTTKDMVYKVLSSRFNVLCNEGTENNLIGVSKTLLRLNSDHNIAVLELGTNHFGEIKTLTEVLKPNVGAITNIGPSHLEFLRSKTGVLKEKSRLLYSLDEGGIAVLNTEDAMLSKLSALRCIQTRFGRGKKCDFRVGTILQDKEGISFTVNNKYNFKINMLSHAYVYNALIAIAVGFLYKVDFKDMHRALLEFRPPDGRLSFKKVGNLDLIDDTYNSNPQSLRVALSAFSGYKTSGRKILVCADMLELGRSGPALHSEAGKLIAYSGLNYLISVGNFSGIIRDSAISNGMAPAAIFVCRNNGEVLDILTRIVKAGDIVLLKGSRAMRLEEVINALSSVIPAKGDMVRV